MGSGGQRRVRAVSHWTRAEFASPLAREVRMGHPEAATVTVKPRGEGVDQPIEAPSIAVRARRGVADEGRRKGTMNHQ